MERTKALQGIYDVGELENPHNMPEARVKEVDIIIFVDADHADNRMTRRSHIGIIIFLNMAPINFYSKKQSIIESFTYGSDFIALKTAQEMLDGIIYKLKVLGVPISGPARIFRDNQSVVKSSIFSESIIKI